MENKTVSKCITTFTGIDIDVFNPTPEMIDIRDIAHALSNICRFGGHSKCFYSVAQHSVHCHDLIDDRAFELDALMHDASEAYLYDFPTPIKKELEFYKSLENNLMSVIAKKFGFSYPISEAVKIIDKEMFLTEWDFLMAKKDSLFTCWEPKKAEERFLSTYNWLNTTKNINSKL